MKYGFLFKSALVMFFAGAMILGNQTKAKAATYGDGGALSSNVYSGSGNNANITISNDNSTSSTYVEIPDNTIVFGYRGSLSGDTTNNTVTMVGGSVRAIFGGQAGHPGTPSSNVRVTGNNVYIKGASTVTGDATEPGVIYGGYSDDINSFVSNNKVTITPEGADSPSINVKVYGGYSNGGDISLNTVEISGGVFAEDIIGGYANTGTLSGNHVEISGGTFGKNIVGAQTMNGNIDNSDVIISGMVTFNSSSAIIGSYVGENGSADHNNVMYASTSTVSNIYGAYTAANASAANNNEVKVRDGIVSTAVYGVRLSGETEAQNNTVKISDNAIVNKVYGAYAYSSTSDINGKSLINNTVTIEGGKVNGPEIAGAMNFLNSENADVKSNTVEITDGQVLTDTSVANRGIYGGYSLNSNANTNKVKISGGSIGDPTDATSNIISIIGGYSDAGSASSNEVTITKGDVINVNITGGRTKNGVVKNNKVTIANDPSINITAKDIIGGYSDDGVAKSNKVTIEGGIFTKPVQVFGAKTAGGNIGGSESEGNQVKISGNNVKLSNVFGGYSETGEVSYNTVEISNGEMFADIYGGYTNSTDKRSMYNNVKITGGNTNTSISGSDINIIGGQSKFKTFGNHVTISAAEFGKITGGYSAVWSESNVITIKDGAAVKGDIIAGYTTEDTGEARANEVHILGGNFDDNTIIGGNGKQAAAFNIVKVSAGRFKYVYGGFTSGLAEGNEITIDGDTEIHEAVYGGYSEGTEENSVAKNNTVTVKGGKITDDSMLIGGYAKMAAKDNTVTLTGGEVATVIGGWSETNTASGNTVIVKDSASVKKYIIAGYSEGSGTAEDNLVVLNVRNLETVSVFGGVNKPTGSTTFTERKTNNSLQILTKGITVKKIGGFDNYAFVLPKSIFNTTEPMLTIAGDEPLQVYSSDKFSIGLKEDGAKINKGDTAVLIHNVEGRGSIYRTSEKTGRNVSVSGDFITNEFNINVIEDELVITCTNIKPNDGKDDPDPVIDPEPDNPLPINRPKHRPYGAKAVMEGQGASMALINSGSDLITGQGMRNAVETSKTANGKFVTFAAASGGKYRYKTGSHVEMEQANIIVGAAATPILPAGKLTTGFFVETGYGDYDTYNPGIHSDGDSKYYGVGLIGKMDFNSGAYLDGSLRLGKYDNNWSTKDLSQPVEYDITGEYYGAHFGIGYGNKFHRDWEYDFSAKIIWNKQTGKEATLIDSHFNFDDVDSVKTRLSAKVAYDGNEKVKPYVGVSFDREYKGAANGTVNNLAIDAPTLKGNTGSMEVGVEFKPNKASNWSLDLGLSGSVGVQKGVRVQGQFMYRF